jgi:phosphoribosyl 1,2-cyclic phosphate phosphodiesterase
MKAIFLGTATSVGIPAIGCRCRVCTSTHPRNKRRRASLYVQSGGFSIVIDTPPDFREQALQYAVPRVDALLITHAHADHVFGFDDIRRYNTLQGGVIPVYASHATVDEMNRIFAYVHKESPSDTYRPQVEFRVVDAPFDAGPFRIEPLPVRHGSAETLGFRLEAEGRTLGYVPDCNGMDAKVIARLRHVDVMILDGLRHRPHSTHFCLSESIPVLQSIGAKQSFLTHMCHDIDHDETQRTLPPAIDLAYDGLTLEW